MVKDADGEWDIKQEKKCIVKLLTKPSQKYLDEHPDIEIPKTKSEAQILREELVAKGVLNGI